MGIGPNGALVCLPQRLGEALREHTRTWLALGDPKRAGYRKILFATADTVTPDAHGRVVVPSQLCALAGLERTVHWVAEGGQWFELWDSGRWEEFQRKLEYAPPAGCEWRPEVVLDLVEAFNRALSDLPEGEAGQRSGQ